MASTRPSVVVTTAAPPKKPATASHELGEGAAGEHDAHEHAVHLVLALEERGLAARRSAARASTRAAGSVGQGGEVDAGAPRQARWPMARSVRPRADRWQQSPSGHCRPLASVAAWPSDRPPSRTVLPAAVSTLSAALVGGPRRRRRRCSGVHRSALYLDVAGRVLPVVTSDAVPLPTALRLAAPCAVPVPWGVVAGDAVLVGAGRVALPGVDVVGCRAPGGPPVRPPGSASSRPACVGWSPGSHLSTRLELTVAEPARLTDASAAGSPTASARVLPASGAQVVARAAACAPDSATRMRGTRSRRCSGAGPGSPRRATTRSPAPCSSPTRSAPATPLAAPCAPGSARPPRCPPPCSTPPPTGSPPATSSPSSTPPLAATARPSRARAARRARHRPHLGRATS